MKKLGQRIGRLCLTPLGRLAAALLLAGCGGRTVPADLPVEERVRLLGEECLRKYPDTPSISLEEFLKLRAEGRCILVDARSVRERNVSIIPGAISVRELDTGSVQGQQATIVVHCTVGCRSGKTAARLRGRGLDAYNLRGGVLAWALAGRNFVTPDGAPTKRVHVYGSRWNALPPGYEAVW
jgi:rhodanese-related sulfurtransferase